MDDPKVFTVINRINDDFEQGNSPFDDVEFPEERLIREVKRQAGNSDEPTSLSMEERARLVTAFSTFDYNRNANQLVDNLLELYDRQPNFFNPWKVHKSEQVLRQVFEEIGFRYPNRDAEGWAKNCRLLREKYHGRVTELILDTGCDAVSLVERLNSDGFSYLKGDKIAPMYARILSDEVAELHDLWKLEIPVDTWVRKITQEIVGSDMTDDEIREWWRNIAPAADIDRHTVDGGIWLIGNNLNEWGEDYLKEVLGTESFKYL